MIEPTPEGTIFFVLQHNDKDWMTNELGYHFPEFQKLGITVKAQKTPTKKLRVTVLVGDEEYTYVGSCPTSPHPEGLPVSARWNESWIDLRIGDMSFPKKSRKT